MIQDQAAIMTSGVGAAVDFVSSGQGIDLNPDFGQGVDPRKAPLVGHGEMFYIRCDVTTAFAIGGGTPVVQAHAVISTNGTSIHTGDPIIVGSAMPSIHLASSRLLHGFVAAQLPVGSHFYIAVNPWTAYLGRNAAGATVIGKDYRYLGVMMSFPVYDVGPGTNFFATGILTCRIVKQSDIAINPKDFVYPSGTHMVG